MENWSRTALHWLPSLQATTSDGHRVAGGTTGGMLRNRLAGTAGLTDALVEVARPTRDRAVHDELRGRITVIDKKAAA